MPSSNQKPFISPSGLIFMNCVETQTTCITDTSVKKHYVTRTPYCVSHDCENKGCQKRVLMPNDAALKDKRLLQYWGTSDPAKIKHIAYDKLFKWVKPNELVPNMNDRILNWDLFVKRHFNMDTTKYSEGLIAPAPNTNPYNIFKQYAMTDFGAAMVKRVHIEYDDAVIKGYIVKATNKEDWNASVPPFGTSAIVFQPYRIFQVVETATGSAMASEDIIKLPFDFPKCTYFVDGNVVHALGVLHHEFEHTRYGNKANDPGSKSDEVAAVILMDNPVRAVYGFEPRTVYYHSDDDAATTKTTINIKTGEKQRGIWQACAENIEKMVKVVPATGHPCK